MFDEIPMKMNYSRFNSIFCFGNSFTVFVGVVSLCRLVLWLLITKYNEVFILCLYLPNVNSEQL